MHDRPGLGDGSSQEEILIYINISSPRQFSANCSCLDKCLPAWKFMVGTPQEHGEFPGNVPTVRASCCNNANVCLFGNMLCCIDYIVRLCPWCLRPKSRLHRRQMFAWRLHQCPASFNWNFSPFEFFSLAGSNWAFKWGRKCRGHCWTWPGMTTSGAYCIYLLYNYLFCCCCKVSWYSRHTQV